MQRIIGKFIAIVFPPIIAHRLVNIIHPLGLGDWFYYEGRGITGSYFKSNTKDLHGRFFYFFGYFDLKNILIVNALFGRWKSGNLCEIGANIGTETIAYSDIVAEKRCVYAFEPEPVNYNQLLNQSYHISGNVKLVNKAISNSCGIMNFLKGDEISSGTGKLQTVSKGSHLENTIQVETITLDSLRLGNIKVMLIDVEGHEPFVLKGAKNTILNCKPIIITEVSKKLLGKYASTTIKDFRSEFENLGYVCYKIGKIRLEKVLDNIGSQENDINWICFPSGEEKQILRYLNWQLFTGLFCPRFIHSLKLR
jgi:FkbM family methyltransferase